MFSSNQKFEVSGDTKEQLIECLKFAMLMGECGERFNFREHTDLVFQKVSDMFCLGTAVKDQSDEEIGKWQRFQFDYEPELVAGVIWQFLQKQDYWCAEDYEQSCYDGSMHKGFVMRALETEECYHKDLNNKIDEMWRGFVYFKPFNTFYAK